MWLYFRLFLVALRLLRRDRQDVVLENLALRQQLAVFQRRGRRPALAPADRRFWSSQTPSCAGIGPRGGCGGGTRVGRAGPAARASIRR